MGITRLGNITGLDRIGIPVAVAVRPNSRSVSVSQGKGLDLPQAMASALMEATEGFHAEEIGQGGAPPIASLPPSRAVVDPDCLCTTGRPFDPDAAIAWIEGYDLLRREPCWVPAEIVHTDYTRPLDGYFLAGSNGLASGNHLVEAISAALYELVERDAVALWSASGIRARAQRALDLASIDDPDCRALLAKYDAAEHRRPGLERHDRYRHRRLPLRDPRPVRGRSAAAAPLPRLGLPCRPGDRAGPRPDRGGADPADLYRRHPRRSVAGGIRGAAGRRDRRRAARRAGAQRRAPHSFRDVPSFAADDLRRGSRAGRWAASAPPAIARVVAVDLTRPEFDDPGRQSW